MKRKADSQYRPVEVYELIDERRINRRTVRLDSEENPKNIFFLSFHEEGVDLTDALRIVRYDTKKKSYVCARITDSEFRSLEREYDRNYGVERLKEEEKRRKELKDKVKMKRFEDGTYIVKRGRGRPRKNSTNTKICQVEGDNNAKKEHGWAWREKFTLG